MRQPTLGQKARQCFPGLESLVLYCETTNTAIISMYDMVRDVEFPALKALGLWRLRPEIGSNTYSIFVRDESVREPLNMHDLITQQGHQSSFTRLWLMSCSEDANTLQEFRKWPKELEFVCRELSESDERYASPPW